ncbi:hypothetical protein R1sor_016439 [Riccia sorocarpa]|uniref:Uncharacterized protein n=1 Tax=Riccia sorocarpa TaxID=122646 RepID=A0ABD3HII3_9MARC
MATTTTILTFDSLVKKIRTKQSVSAAWFVTLDLADATLLLWRFNGDEPIPLGVYRLYDKVMQSNQNYKILEREAIKEALNAGFFGVMAKEPSHYLPHPECVKKSRGSAFVQADTGRDEDDIGDEELAEDIRKMQRHEKERCDAAKKSHKDKGKAVDTSQPRKKSQSTPKEKLLGLSMVAEKTRLSRESDNDVQRRKREREAMNVPTPPPKKHQSNLVSPPPRKQQYVTLSPPPRKKPVEVEEVEEVEEVYTEEEAESESDRNDDDAGVAVVEKESDSPHAKKVVTKRGSKLKTLKEMEPMAGIDREKQETRRKAVERCRVSSVPIVIPLEQLVEPTLE